MNRAWLAVPVAVGVLGAAVYLWTYSPGEIYFRKTPGCGNCSFNRSTGVLTAALQKRVAGEPDYDWNVVGLKVGFDGGAEQTLSLLPQQDAAITANGACPSRTFTFNVTGLGQGTINKLELVLKHGADQWRRGCIKNGDAVLASDCNCCSCF